MRFLMLLIVDEIIGAFIGIYGVKIQVLHLYPMLALSFIFGLLLGYFAMNKIQAIISGFLYGISLLFFYLVTQYAGVNNIMKIFFPFITIWLTSGAVVGILVQFLANLIPPFQPWIRR